ncbi:DNA-binding transcriptional LysR family regulator [Nonomuraea polychroma]|uniref:DNA-binding transcriptional LysR family regulator n=1 Tax=Nonomuraea polychroma TaxID=46176 RepID=A0A438M4G7_9ACTN|nr:LysR family transcriptional regulator [Nonomuraea polychroma]RVX40734.1 DNA-binding transcriptional LysR family regulator [Nonomuraea polychroma]
MELRQLQYFVAVAEEGGFARAAERLNIVQSAVSQQVRRLERELGVRLFDRSTRHVRLSAAGERLLPEVRTVLGAADRLRGVAAGIADGTDGVLRLGAIHSTGDRLSRGLAELAVIAPRLRVRLKQAPPAERLAAVREGRLEAALVRAQAAVPGLRLIPVWTDPLFAALPADHVLAAEPRLRLEQLACLPLRLAPREKNPPFHDLITAACRAAGIAPPPGPPFTSLRETLSEMATDAPSWTVFYEVSGFPSVPGIAVRPLAEPAVVTSLAVRAAPLAAPIRQLLTALKPQLLPGQAPSATGGDPGG